MVIINRENVYIDRLRSYKIIIDGKCYDKIKDGEIKNINIGPGNHTIYLTIDWCKSNKIDFNISENETIAFECGNSMNGWRIIISLLYVTFLKNKYLWIRRK